MICLGKATDAVKRALALDDTYPQAHVAAGNIFLMRAKHDQAIDSLKLAIAANPGDAGAY